MWLCGAWVSGDLLAPSEVPLKWLRKITLQTDLRPVFTLTRRLVQDIFRQRSQKLILGRAPGVWAFFRIRTRPYCVWQVQLYAPLYLVKRLRE